MQQTLSKQQGKEETQGKTPFILTWLSTKLKTAFICPLIFITPYYLQLSYISLDYLIEFFFKY